MTNSKVWRVAYIGAGAIVQMSHAPNFQAIENTDSVAICDVNETRAQQVASSVGIPAVYGDYQQMLDAEQPDITVVATPNRFHKDMAMAALAAGSHVLCEKPLALNYADAVAMFDAARAAARVLTVGTHFRFSSTVQACKAQRDAGFFGKLYAARTLWIRRSGIPGIGGWFTNRDLAGGGALLDIGVHALDRALYLLGYPKPVTVSGVTLAEFGPRGRGAGGWGVDAQGPRPANPRFDVDDLAWALVRFDNGAVLQFQVTWASHQPDQYYTELFGTEGGAYVGDRDKLELYSTMNGQNVTINVPLPQNQPSSYARLIQNFVRHLDGDLSAEIVTAEQALVSVQIVDAIGRSAASGHEVALG